MRSLLIVIVSAMSFNAFAAGTLDCTSEDGSSMSAIVNLEAGSVPHQVKYRVRSGELRDAVVLQYLSTVNFSNGFAGEEVVKTIALRDKESGQLAMVITDGTLIDSTGTYSAECTMGY